MQDPDSVAAALRTVSMRLTGTSAKELEDMGEDTEGLIETTSKLKDTIQSLTAVNGKMGVSITKANGSYKSTYEILQEIADIWQEIQAADAVDGKNRANALLETIAGKNRASVVASILDDAELLEEVYTQVQESSGSAEQELSKYLDSIEGKTNSLTNSWQEFWSKSFDTETIKTVLDLLNGVVQALTDMGGLVPILGTVGSAIAAAKGFG